MARGKIIFYNAAEGRGIANNGSAQVPFEIGQWRGSEAPRLNQVVEVAEGPAGTLYLTPVDEAAFFAEKAGESMKGLGEAAGPLTKAFLAQIGVKNLIAYAVFAVAAFYWTFVLADFDALTLSNLLRPDGEQLFLWVAVLTVGVPYFWKDRRAWLTWTLPLVVTVVLGIVPVVYDNLFSGLFSLVQETGTRFGVIGGHIIAGMGSLVLSLRLGAYVTVASSGYLAWAGVIRFQQTQAAQGSAFPSSNPAGGTSAIGVATTDDRTKAAKSLTQVLYVLYALSFFFGITGLIAVIINYVKKGDVAGTFCESHFRWQIRTFWIGLVFSFIGVLTSMILIGIPILIGVGIWYLYRIIKGWLDLRDNKVMYGA
jgi:uncharacterized membrane protein